MVRLLLIAVLYLTIHAAVAQKYASGYIIALNGDTVRCEIESKRWDQNPTVIHTRGSGNSLTYRPGDILAFHVDNETYLSAFVDIETSRVAPGELDDHPNFTYEQDTVFLQQLVAGRKSLYFFKDGMGKRHFYIHEAEKYVHLDYKQYVRVENTPTAYRRGTMENRRYVGQLTNYLDCAAMKDRIPNARYEEGALTKLFKSYFECTQEKDGMITARHEMTVELGLMAGMTMTTIKFQQSAGFHFMLDADFEPSFNPVLGFFVDLRMLRGRGSRVTNDFMYTSFNLSGEGDGGGNGTVPYHVSARLNYHYLKTHHAFQLALAREGRFFVSGGFSFGFVMANNSKVEVLYSTGSVLTPEYNSINIQAGLVGGMGVNLGRFSAEARYEWSTGVSNIQTLRDNLERGYVLVKYRLKHKPAL